jgi:diguanylate cyclase
MNFTRPDLNLPEASGRLEHREAQWRCIDELLHRLLSRLAYEAEDRSAALAATLSELRLAVRDSIAEERMPPLLDALSEAVKALDEAPLPADAPRPQRDAAAHPPALGELLLAVLDRLQLDDGAMTTAVILRREIANCIDPHEMHRHGEALATLVSRQLQQLEADRRAAERLLRQIDDHLGALADYLEQDDRERQGQAAARQQLGALMLDEVQALGERLQSASSIETLRASVQASLLSLGHNLHALRQREESRARACEQQLARMRERVQHLEQSTRSMEATLAKKHQLIDIDALTGLANRRSLDARMASLCETGTSDTSLLMLDIDHFKGINDRLGHAAGDRALRIVAEQLQAALRPNDFLARYGGEEFVAIIAADADEALQVAERLRDRLERTRFRSQSEPVQLTLSCGIATVRDDDTPETVFERADRALYCAKNTGRNRCVAL